MTGKQPALVPMRLPRQLDCRVAVCKKRRTDSLFVLKYPFIDLIGTLFASLSSMSFVKRIANAGQLQRSRHLFLMGMLCLLLAAVPARPAAAQVQTVQTKLSAVLGESLTFKAEVSSDLAVQAAAIFFSAAEDSHTNVGLAAVRRQGENLYELEYTHQLADYYIPPFSRITFHWELTLSDGSVFLSPEESAEYTENRFQWQTLEESGFRVHWSDGDLTFGQEIINIARASVTQISEIIPQPGLAVMDIYVYPDLATMRPALRPDSEEWVAGSADPKLGVILVALPAGAEQKLLAEQRIPHEMMHVLLYQDYPRGYKYLPRWLTEGLASLVERNSNPDYRISLSEAARDQKLIPMQAICQDFPQDTASSLLAYAQSQSFVQYLFNTYGASGLQNLITAYSNGLDCQNGALQGLGRDLNRLESDWQRSGLGQPGSQGAIQNLLPWLILLLAALIAPLAAILRSHARKTENQGKKPEP